MMVQPAKKGEQESKGTKRQKGDASSSSSHTTAGNKRQQRVDQSPTIPRKRINSGGVANDHQHAVNVEGSDHHVENNNNNNGTEVDINNIIAIRDSAVEKKLELIKQLMEQKENELKEIAYLEAGHNLMDYDATVNKSKVIHTAKEEPGDGVPPPSPGDNKKGPGRPAKDPNAPSRKKPTPNIPPPPTTATTSTPVHTPTQQDSFQSPTPPAAQTPTQPVPSPSPQPPSQGVVFHRPQPIPPTFPSIFTTPSSLSDADKERAMADAEIVRRVAELQRTGMWSLKRLPKAPEPPRVKVHWDHVVAEMAWLANDFKQERKWKMALAKKASKQVLKYHHMQETREQRKRKEEEHQLRKLASSIAREVKKFWQKIEKVVEFKVQAKLDEKKKEVRDKHLDFLVGQTEKYFEMIANDLKQPEGEQKLESITEEGASQSQAAEPTELQKSQSHTQMLLMDEEGAEGAEGEDAEFELPEDAADEVDDEETLEEEETNKDDELPKGDAELEQLEKEKDMPVEEIIKQFKEQGGKEGEEVEGEEDEDEDDDEEGNDGRTGQDRISEAAAAANAAQPTGFTLSTTKVKTKVPFLLHGTLREYQHIGLDWIVTMYEKRLNGILADEMGLGKTIMTISMLAHLACEKGIWGPHLIVVPTSVMLNWEMEFKKWCPAFKILTYFGTQKERKRKRQGWSMPNSFHVCITSYQVVVQDQQAFRRKKWKYFILDEAHNIKNFKSQRWQVLLNFNSKRRLLLTGTPLQNSLMELWSLMHFLMPHMFQSHKEFKDWFSNPVTGMIEGTETLNEDLITRLHAVLRPFLLRRMKKDVEKQLPGKYHHIVPCQLSKRQRFLYEEFMSSAMTQDTLKSGNFLGIINVLMQLRKVCNHPDLFEGRPIISPFDMDPIEFYTSSAVCRALEHDPFKSVNLPFLNLSLASTELEVGGIQSLRTSQSRTPSPKIIELSSTPATTPSTPPFANGPSFLDELRVAREARFTQSRLDNRKHIAYINEIRCSRKPVYGHELVRAVNIHHPVLNVHSYAKDPTHYQDYPNTLAELVKLPETRAAELNPTLITEFVCIIPKARAPPPQLACPHPNPSDYLAQRRTTHELTRELAPAVDIYRPAFVRAQVYFPDKRLVQYDCGKLQQLDLLLRKLKSGGHRALIFTQMTRMLDVLEAFLNIHGHTYMRLDGSTKVEKRQQLTELFNADPKYFVFILSTRSGGVGINLTGADSVIFYDSDWNPAMDAQAQDRCHRIGQTRDVHIYRLVTEYTIEENILKKANQKRHLDDMVIKGGGFTTDFFKNVDIRDLFDSTQAEIERESVPIQLKDKPAISQQDWESAVANAEDETDAIALRQAQAEQDVDHEEFNEEGAQQDTTHGGESAGGDQDLSFLQQEEDEMQSQNGKLSSSGGFAFEDSLLPIQRYALRYMEAVNPAADQESLDAMDEEVDARQQEWELENVKRMQEEEEERMSEEEDQLFYEVSGNAAEFRAKLLAEMEVYCPPNPDLEHLYIPPYDGDYFSQFPPLPPPFEDDDDELPQPDKKSPPPTPPGEAEPVKEKEKEKKKREKKLKPPTATAEAPPSPPPAKKKGRGARDGYRFPKKPPPVVDRDRKKEKDLYPWSTEEDAALAEATRLYGLNWELACDVLLSNSSLPSRKFLRTPAACAERYRSVVARPGDDKEKEKEKEKDKDKEKDHKDKEKEKEKEAPPTSPAAPALQPHFGILDVIRSMVNQKKDIPGMIGSAAQTDQAVAPHPSHLQAALHAGITSNKSLTPREVISMLSQRVQLAIPPKEIPVLTKLAYKLDPKFGVQQQQGPGLGMGSSMASAIAASLNSNAQASPTMTGQPSGVPGASMVPPGASFSGSSSGTGAAAPAANSIIINPNGSGNTQTSRKLAQINQSMHPGTAASPATATPRNGNGSTAVPVSAAPPVVVAIPNAPANVTVVPRANATAATPVAPTVNISTTTPVIPATPAATPAPAQPSPAATTKASAKRGKKNANNANDGATTTKRARTKNSNANTPAAAAPVEPSAAAPTTQPLPAPVQSAQPVQATQPPQPGTQPHTHMASQAQAQPLQPQQLHQLQQIHNQLNAQHMQHQPGAHMQSSTQPIATHVTTQPQPQPPVAQPQSQPQPQPQAPHIHPTHAYQPTQPTTNQPQPQPGTQPYTATTYVAAPTYATAPTYPTTANYTTPTTGITYATTYATAPTYTTAPTTATPTTYATPAAGGTFANPTNTYTTPTYNATPGAPTTYTTVTPTYTTVPPTAYVVAPTARTFTPTTAPAYTTTPTYIAATPAGTTFVPNSATPYATNSAVGYAPGMVIGTQPTAQPNQPQPQPTLKGRPTPQPSATPRQPPGAGAGSPTQNT